MHGQVQPLAVSRVNGMAGIGMQRRVRLRTGFGRLLLEEHHAAVEGGCIHLHIIAGTRVGGRKVGVQPVAGGGLMGAAGQRLLHAGVA